MKNTKNTRKENLEREEVYASDLEFEDFPRKKRGNKKKDHQFYESERIDAWEVLEDERQAVAEFFM